MENSGGGWGWRNESGVSFLYLQLDITLLSHMAKVILYLQRRFRQPEPYFCPGEGHGVNVMFIRASEVLENESAPRAFHTRGIALELPSQSIPTLT